MDYYELEYTVENLLDDLKKKQKTEEEEHGKYDPNSMMKSAQNNQKSSINIPKMPNMSSNVPRIPSGLGKIPKI